MLAAGRTKELVLAEPFFGGGLVGTCWHSSMDGAPAALIVLS